ncbi:hypothetical protein LTR66_006079 [Elasticomyces elasticus]|nr:hypothetical protein LTR50_007296 [Elasticomyces elasticus]KAK4993205.1 hypothetical protein LTR66_006079 [Elasticomyces elasticus]
MFNTVEVKEFLKRDGKPKVYKVADNSPSANPWGSKLHQMANGKDFFVELSKQITTVQASGGK